MSLALMIRKDGIVDPFGLNWLRTSKFPLIAGTRDGLDEVGGMDGAVDFGSMLGTDDIVLELVSEDGLSPVEIVGLRNTVVGYLNQMRDYGTLSWEADPDKVLSIRLNGKPSRDVTIPNAFKISIPLLCQPLWKGVVEQMKAIEMDGVYQDVLVNAGTIEAPVKVEIRGPCTNPSIVIGLHALTYTGTLTSSDVLVIDTDALTCTFNGVNALANLEGLTPDVKLQPGNTAFSRLGSGTAIFSWSDRFL